MPAPIPFVLTLLEALSLMLLGGTTQTEAHPTVIDLAIASESVILALAMGGISDRIRRPRLEVPMEDVSVAALIERIGKAPLTRAEPSLSSDLWAEPSSLSLGPLPSRAARGRPRWRELISEADPLPTSPSPTDGPAPR